MRYEIQGENALKKIHPLILSHFLEWDATKAVLGEGTNLRKKYQ